ncbi:MAG: metallophosphoesterase [Aurantimicrobium sp.]|nr:metallophosphoesterase [Aurantimicrobium sp.]
MFTLRTQQARIESLGRASLRILHLSDMHTAPWQRDKATWVRTLRDLSPELVIATGDFLGHPDALPRVKEALEGFAGVPGAFVFGSNDYFVSQPKNPFAYFAGPSRIKKKPARLNTDALRAFLVNDLGWHDINNGASRLTVAGVTVDLVGVDDPHIQYDRCDEALTQLDDLRIDDASSRSGAARESASLTIGVTHAPYRRILNQFSSNGADIIVAGHTHGGQVCVPGVGALVTNCDIPRRQASGFSTWQGGGHVSLLNVSAGLGTSIYAPIRFACPPEASVIDLAGPEFIAN